MSNTTDPDDSGEKSSPATRATGATDRSEHAPEAGPDNHLALIYETREEQLDSVVPFVRQGLEQNERIMYVADENSPEDLVASFSARGLDAEAALDSGQLTIHTPADTYGEPEEFDADEMIDAISEIARNIVNSESYSRLRITGEMTWALDDGVDTLDRLLEYESRVNNLYTEDPVIGLCQYNRERFSSGLLYDIIRAHPHQVYNGTVTQNLSYYSPRELAEADSRPSPPEIERFIESNLDRIRAHSERERRQRTLSELAESSLDLLHGDTDTVVERTITTIERALSPSIAAVFWYDEASDTLRPEAVWLSTTDDAESVSLPDQYQALLEDTFATGDSQVFSNVQSPAELPSLEAVLQSGMTFPLNDYGVLFVGSTHAGAFDESDVEFAQTVARSAHTAIERAEHERELEEQNERLDRFASKLAHELRNPVMIGQIYSQQVPREAAPEAVEYVREAFDRIEDMVDMLLVLTRGQEMMGDVTTVQLEGISREAWADVNAPSASLRVTGEHAVQADETYLRHFFRNLFENAVKHGGEDVTVTVGELPDGFYVADDGPGIPPDEQEKAFEAGYTTASDCGGTGLGLAYVAEFVDIYDWECAVGESANGGARFEFTNVERESD
jgi:signal transduction histidine kinase